MHARFESIEAGKRVGTDRIPIAVTRLPGEQATARLLELADACRWQLIGLAGYEDELPTNVDVVGALINHPPEAKVFAQVIKRGIPTVRIGRIAHRIDRFVPAVLSDRFAIGQLAAEHFAQREFRHVAYIGHPSWAYNRVIYQGLAARARELGCECHIRRMHGEERPPESYGSPMRWQLQQADFTRSLGKFPTPVGLLASSDQTALRYCRWIHDAGLRVPEDVAVLGIGDNRFDCETARIPVSSVIYDWDRLVDTAVGLLRQLIRGESPSQNVTLVPPLGIATRRSTDVLAAADDKVVAALRFMWDRADQNLSVDQVARHVKVSRRVLERAFERELGRGIFEEFQRRRLEHARNLLIQTDSRIAAIASQMGFSSQSYFCQVFRRSFGMSPAQYRAQRKNAKI